MSTRSIVSLVALALLAFWAVGAYNRLVRLKNTIANAFGTLDLQFKERHDLLLMLAEAAGEYLQHDPGSIEALLQARSAASSANDAVRARPSSARLVQGLMAAEKKLAQQLEALWAASTTTLAMQAEPKIRELAQQLSTIQSKLAFACQGFNACVADFNAAQRQFPTLLIARLFGFSAALPLHLGIG